MVQKFDALDANLQLLLKTAATIGNVFSVSALRSIYDSLAVTAQLSLVANANGSSEPISPRQKPFNNSQSRASAASEMFQRNNFEADILKLIDLGMFSSHDFCPVLSLYWTERNKGEIQMSETADSPEIGIHSLHWRDARGALRRGWAAVTMAPEMPPRFEFIESLVPASGDEGLDLGHQSPMPSGGNFYKFSHPSIQSTACSLSLQLDRVPVHAATLEYLSRNFPLSPGVEETCLYHAMHLKDTQESLPWLFKCTGRGTVINQVNITSIPTSTLTCTILT